MTPDLLDLARRVAGCARWRWLPGMADETGERYLGDGQWASGGEVSGYLSAEPGGEAPVAPPDVLPDLTDPLTALGLLVLVREAWNDPDIAAVPFWFHGSLRWRVGAMMGGDFVEPDYGDKGYATEVEALAHALLAAPEVTR